LPVALSVVLTEVPALVSAVVVPPLIDAEPAVFDVDALAEVSVIDALPVSPLSEPEPDESPPPESPQAMQSNSVAIRDLDKTIVHMTTA
jgi:hypothetical protein